ncbi:MULTISPECIES: hypothetical protein [unclassified Burkholderia]|uniref:hypothetical protein n=1 Tax=unclassified Burkholderia TaxID=2613784 RepID=UPI002AB24C47|nr:MULTISPECIES: hypothetical protein [unclassified Burkholderia]
MTAFAGRLRPRAVRGIGERRVRPSHRRLARGGSYDNALAETINGLYKTELT